ncbi:hypothetical protein [Brucella sp. BO2]|uniref:hypothetical protein n=1 Tax=Brucella sp. BO2 TaxID=693750 RepID=UPI00030704E4|nr:hypothetical protein [Brucella sp. BO2]
MTDLEIIDLFIRAAAIDQKLPNDAKPKKLRGQRLPGMSPLTEDEQRGWSHKADREIVLQRHGKKMRIGTASKLHKDDEGPFQDWWMAFWESDEISRKDISDWEQAMNLIALSASPENRRCFWAWSRAKAGCLFVQVKNRAGKVRIEKASFAKWCRLEGIHEETGRRRKDRAIAIINQHVMRDGSPNAESGRSWVLPTGPDFEHIPDTVAVDAPPSKEMVRFERDAETEAAKREEIFKWEDEKTKSNRLKARLRKQFMAAA